MTRSFLAVCAVLCASAAPAQEADRPEVAARPPATSLTPKSRVEALEPDDVEAAAVDAEETEAAPEELEPGLVAEDNEVDVVDSAPPVPERIASGAEELASCLADLAALGATFEAMEAISESDDADCGIVNPVQVSVLPGGVALEPAAPMRCETAVALAQWTRDHALPAAARLPERGELEAIEQGSTYICRRRNNLPEGKLSEHAFGNAVDIMAFRFESGDPIPVQPRERDGTMAEAFQDAVRATACLHFTTVLGPGSDESHADHLHLDVKDRRGGFRLCQ